MTQERPRWFARREIAPFTLDDDQVDQIVNSATHAVVSWVTKKNEPVQAVMVYVVIDGKLTVTSTTNRAKYHSWRRNPAASFCITDPDSVGRQVTLRGRMEILHSDELLRQFVEGFLSNALKGETPSAEVVENEIATFAAPDRHMMQLHVEKTLSHDLPSLLRAERDGTDAWT